VIFGVVGFQFWRESIDVQRLRTTIISYVLYFTYHLQLHSTVRTVRRLKNSKKRAKSNVEQVLIEEFTDIIMAANWRPQINYVTGDATQPVGAGNKFIVHICNDIGAWGGGFTGAVSYRWFKPEIAYHHYCMLSHHEEFLELGTTQLVRVERDIWVVNLIGQHGTGNHAAVPPIRYEAVRKGLDRVAALARSRDASVHMPRIGCGLAGGSWDRIEPLIYAELIDKGIQVTVYEP
jgi:O-acetyl-ADP-ribose deacetylase (regulator of RNase III)